MPYTLNRYNGKQLLVLQDGTLNITATDLKLAGRNYAGYGQSLNENLIYLLENFAGSSEPPNKISGQLWYDSNTRKIKLYDGLRFRPLGSVEFAGTAPANQTQGDMWFNSTTGQLYVYNGAGHQLIGPAQTGTGVNQLQSKLLVDTTANLHTVLEAIVENRTIGIFSNAEFTIDNTKTPLTGFGTVYKGLNLASQAEFPNIQFAGVAKTSKSLLIDGIEVDASRFVQNSSGSNQTINASLTVAVSPDALNRRGLFVGTNGDLYLYADSGVGVVSNPNNNTLSFGVRKPGTTGPSVITSITEVGLIPSSDFIYNIGSSVQRWNNVYATNFYATDNPLAPAGNAAFRGRVEGTTVNASNSFNGKLNGDVYGNVYNRTNIVVDNGSTTTVFTGRLNGDLYGDLYSAFNNAKVINTAGTTAIFTGNLTGVAATSSFLRVGSLDLAGKSAGLAGELVNTVAVRDENGNLIANQFIGRASQATALIDESSAQRNGQIGTIINGLPNVTGQTVAIRNNAGDLIANRFIGDADGANSVRNAVPSYENVPTISAGPGRGTGIGTLVQRDPIYGNINVYVVQCEQVDAVGNVNCEQVNARGGDLAEMYLTDEMYEPGTVVTIGGDVDITVASGAGTTDIFGVISTAPGSLLNTQLGGHSLPVALVGRVPVKVKGPIIKGQRVILSDEPGVGIAASGSYDPFAVIGRALQDDDFEGIRPVECFVAIR